MINKIFPKGRGSLNYITDLLNAFGQVRAISPKVMPGSDPERTRQICEQYGCDLFTGVFRFAGSDTQKVNDYLLDTVQAGWEEYCRRGLPAETMNFFWITHQDKLDEMTELPVIELHYGIPAVNLLTGQKLDLYLDQNLVKGSLDRLGKDAFTEGVNIAFDLMSAQDPVYALAEVETAAKDLSHGGKSDGKGAYKAERESVRAFKERVLSETAREAIAERANNQGEVVEFLQKDYEVGTVHHDYIKVWHPETGKWVKLTKEFCQGRYNGTEARREREFRKTASKEDLAKRDKEKLAEYQKRYQRSMEQRIDVCKEQFLRARNFPADIDKASYEPSAPTIFENHLNPQLEWKPIYEQQREYNQPSNGRRGPDSGNVVIKNGALPNPQAPEPSDRVLGAEAAIVSLRAQLKDIGYSISGESGPSSGGLPTTSGEPELVGPGPEIGDGEGSGIGPAGGAEQGVAEPDTSYVSVVPGGLASQLHGRLDEAKRLKAAGKSPEEIRAWAKGLRGEKVVPYRDLRLIRPQMGVKADQIYLYKPEETPSVFPFDVEKGIQPGSYYRVDVTLGDGTKHCVLTVPGVKQKDQGFLLEFNPPEKSPVKPGDDWPYPPIPAPAKKPSVPATPEPEPVLEPVFKLSKEFIYRGVSRIEPQGFDNAKAIHRVAVLDTGSPAGCRPVLANEPFEKDTVYVVTVRGFQQMLGTVNPRGDLTEVVSAAPKILDTLGMPSFAAAWRELEEARAAKVNEKVSKKTEEPVYPEVPAPTSDFQPKRKRSPKRKKKQTKSFTIGD